MSDTVSAKTQQYWLDTVLGWAEARLLPPQFDECKRALMQLEAAGVLAGREQAAAVCDARAEHWRERSQDTGDDAHGDYWAEADMCARAIRGLAAP